jgi:hypothetical protein
MRTCTKYIDIYRWQKLKGVQVIAALLTLLIKLLNTPSNIQALVQLLTKMLKSLG